MPATRTAQQIRRDFIDYFRDRHDHTFVPSSSVVPVGDPTLMFTNAGMNQFKDVFLGQGSRPYVRAANSQKCIRAGGKHNDLEDVGKDTYHHTFFEMLGNWSFGDYFKAEAIDWAWDLLVNVWGIEADRLYVTVFEGDERDGQGPDLESEELWTRYCPPERISRWGRKDNFWEMGLTGPCGPCSEIHFDSRADDERVRLPGAELVNRDHPDVIEIWNLVFIQFNRGPSKDPGQPGPLAELAATGVDTGMGLERVVRVLQGTRSNYDTDLWTPVFESIRAQTSAPAYGGVLDHPIDIAYRVIADHVRCLTVALTDGARPGAEGAGYVLRRILRRAVRHAHQTLGVEGPVLCRIVPSVVESLGDAFPELREQQDHVATIIAGEEEGFLRTLDKGLALFDRIVEQSKAAGTSVLCAEDGFRLHDTHGFPIDLTRVMAEEQDMTVDEAGYETLMERAREKSRAGSESTSGLTLPPDALAQLRYKTVQPTQTDDIYHGRPITATIKAIWNGSDFDEEARPGDAEIAVITDRTNFYAESGGQVGDVGRILDIDGDHSSFDVEVTHRVGDFVLHIGRLDRGKLSVGERVQMLINRDERGLTRGNHTGTHLLNHALREVVGDDVDQRGSLVAPDRLRFDFTCGQAMTIEQIADVQQRVSAAIDRDLPVHADAAPLEQAQRIHGVRAVFGERYPDPVRVVCVGAPIPDLLADPENAKWRDYSIEFCGGTHLDSTRQADSFIIVHEQALAAGIRRITALTGPAARAATLAGADLLQKVQAAASYEGQTLVAAADDLWRQFEHLSLGELDKRRIEPLIQKLRKKARKVTKAAEQEKRSDVVAVARDIATSDTHLHPLPGGAMLVASGALGSGETLLSAADAVAARRPEAALMLLSPDDAAGRVAIVAKVPSALIERGLKAGDWVKPVAKICGGGGGGRPDMAQAAGKNTQRVAEAIEEARRYAQEVVQ